MRAHPGCALWLQFIQWNIHKSGLKVSEYSLPADATGPFVLSGYSGYKQVQVPRGRLFAFDSEGNYMLTCSATGGIIYKVPGGVVVGRELPPWRARPGWAWALVPVPVCMAMEKPGASGCSPGKGLILSSGSAGRSGGRAWQPMLHSLSFGKTLSLILGNQTYYRNREKDWEGLGEHAPKSKHLSGINCSNLV